MRKGILFLLFAVFSYSVYANEINIEASLTYLSRYIDKGQDVFADNDAGLKPEVGVEIKDVFARTDMHLGVWAVMPLSCGHNNAEETDYAISFVRQINENLNLSFGYTYIDFPRLNKRSDISETWAALTVEQIPHIVLPLYFSMGAMYDFAAASGGPDEGWFYYWTVGLHLPLPVIAGVPLLGEYLDVSLTNWGNDGAADLPANSLYATEYALSTTYNFKGFAVTPSVNYLVSYDDGINNGNDEVWFSVKIAYNF